MRAVIMAGGSGSRLWPSSRGLYPKQFLSIPNQETMLQATLSRVQGLSNSTSVICNEEHRFIVAQQAQEMGEKLGLSLIHI